MSEIINLQNISVFQNNILILSSVNFSVSPGEFVYIIGKTGSGKSSLLKTIYAELPLLDGEATIAGYNLRQIRKKDVPYLRRKLGIVFQDFQLLSDRSVADNLKFVMKATGWNDKLKIQDNVNHLLQKTGIPTKGFKLPHQLSGGEQQRVGVARALINNPALIIADEPTGNLDPESSEGIMKLLMEISANGCSVLMATHNYNLIRKFPSRVVRLDQGRLTETPLNDPFWSLLENQVNRDATF